MVENFLYNAKRKFVQLFYFEETFFLKENRKEFNFDCEIHLN